MKKSFSKQLTAMFTIAILVLVFTSCSKDNAVQPQTNNQSAALADQTMLRGEIAARQVSPGVYKISKFIDTNDDETRQFHGYTFDFASNGVLTATTSNGTVFKGTWKLNSAQTKMTISISGNNALKDLDDDDWKVDAITNMRIRISAPGPDSVVFVKI